MNLLPTLQNLRDEVDRLHFGRPITHVYNPLAYAWEAHRLYVERYAHKGIRALWIGMNPGPFGMAQTGVPFGEIDAVKTWLKIETPIQKPALEHPKRPVQGFACERSEVSGRRLWGWAKERFGTPKAFFERFFVHNYCPLSFMEESGRNFTPDKLPEKERTPLFALCDQALIKTVETLKPTLVLGIGTFAEKRIKAALGDRVPIARVLHPSPASPAANRGWAQAAEKTLSQLGLLDLDQSSAL
jgi:single-strand selective monofunctional uracil DNA glycosylase